MILSVKRVITIRNIVGQSDVDAFLSDVREAIREKRRIFHSEKEKNRKTLAALGLCTQDVYDVVSSLTYDDYVYGPVPDDRSGINADVWIFKKYVDWLWIYIKLEFVSIKDRVLVVMSFHEDNTR